jgi:hypothetical protein
LEQLLTGKDPTPVGTLVTVRDGDVFIPGTTVRPLQRVMYRLASGLLVPPSVAVPKGLLDDMQVYLTPDETTGEHMPISVLAHLFTRMSAEQAVQFAAWWTARLEHPRADRHAIDQEFLENYLAEPHRTRVRNLLRDESRALVVPQALMFLAHHGLRFSRVEGGIDLQTTDHVPALASLGIPAYLSPDIDESAGDLVVTKVPGRLGRDLIAIQMFNARKNRRTSWATFQRCWRELPLERVDDPRMQVNLPGEFERATGVRLDDLVLLCAVLSSAVMVHGQPSIQLQSLDMLGWATERRDRALRLIAADPEQMRQMLDQEAEEYPGTWSTRTFDQFPVVHWGDRLTVLSPMKLANRAAGLWPMWDIARELGLLGDSKRVGQVRSTVAYSHETWVLEAFAGIVGDASRFYSETKLRAAYPKGKVADAALDYGSAWVVVEVTTPGLKADTAAGVSDEAVVRDLQNCVAKATQLDATIKNLRDDERALTGQPASAAKRFYPVLVIADRFAANPILMVLLWERVQSLGILQGVDVAPLEVMELEDLDVVEGYIEESGPDLVSVLESKTHSNYRAGTMHQYVTSGLGKNPLPPARVRDRWALWIDLARENLPGVA